MMSERERLFRRTSQCFSWLVTMATVLTLSSRTTSRDLLFAAAADQGGGCGGGKKETAESFQQRSLRSGAAEERAIIMLEGTETPTFMCAEANTMLCDPKSQQASIFEYILAEVDPSAKLVSSNTGIANVLFVEMDKKAYRQNMTGRKKRRSLAARMVRRHSVSQSYEMYIDDVAEEVGANWAKEAYCATGKGVKVAVLDSGIDYTHRAFGGRGTVAAYREAYGVNPYSPRTQQRDGLFPTPVVYDGYDFIGDIYASTPFSIRDDNDPIDRAGHGTSVGHAILAVAPEAQLLAVKVCGGLLDGRTACPDFALLRGVEYAMDPNFDGNIDDRVDIINVSLGRSILSSYYDTFSFALENAFILGALPVVAFGNDSNRPYIAGANANLPSALSVAALTHPDPDLVDDGAISSGVTSFSSRGPGEGHSLKPDLAAPGWAELAQVGTGDGVDVVAGTSFSAPVATGAAALLKQKCPNCSPLAIKALLMNNVEISVKYSETGEPASLTHSGSGALRIGTALEATYWAYSIDEGDVQPSISLGLINAAEDMIIERRIRVTSIAPIDLSRNSTLLVRAAFRDPTKAASGAVRVVIPEPVIPAMACGESTTIVVEFHITASLAPPNFLDTGRDPTQLDQNEFGGHIFIGDTLDSGFFNIGGGRYEKEISVPFYAVVRQAGKLQLDPDISPTLAIPNCSHFETNLTVRNHGAGVAQVDAYEILVLDDDEEEGDRGGGLYIPDIRAVGYRTLPDSSPDCTYILEFAFVLWERPQHLAPTFARIEFFDDSIITSPPRYLFYSTLSAGQLAIVTEVADCTGFESACASSPRKSCSRFEVDHSPGSGNAVLRVCSDQVGISEPTTARVRFSLEGLSDEVAIESGPVALIRVPNAVLSAPSYDIAPGRTLSSLTITKEDVCKEVGSLRGTMPKGIQIVTNAYRGEDGRSGSGATVETETLLLPTDGAVSHSEVTGDDLTFPDATDLQGPTCEGGWLPLKRLCDERIPTLAPTPMPTPRLTPYPTMSIHPTFGPRSRRTREPTCPPQDFPRPEVPTEVPSTTPTTSLAPSQSPTAEPTVTAAPSLFPSVSLQPTIEMLEASQATKSHLLWSFGTATLLTACQLLLVYY